MYFIFITPMLSDDTPMLSDDSVNKHFADKQTKKYDYYDMKVWECYYPESNDYCKYFLIICLIWSWYIKGNK